MLARLVVRRNAKTSSRRWLASAPAPLTQRRTTFTPSKRLVTVFVAFSAGLSLILFLEDPTKVDHIPLSPRRFSPAWVASLKDAGPDAKLIELAIPAYLLPEERPKDLWAPIWSVYIKDDDLQVERPYTPLYGISEEGRMLFWIKQYQKGEVARWLHSKRVGERVEIRAPLRTWLWKDDVWDDVVMISGGTGITPFIQLFNTTISKLPLASRTRFTLVHSSKTPAELPPSELMDPLRNFADEHPERLRFHVFVDEDDGSRRHSTQQPMNSGRIDEKSLEMCLDSERNRRWWWENWFLSLPKQVPRRIMFLVCGPEQMISAVAGPYGRNYSQGNVDGILGRLGYTSEQVYKL